MMPCDAKRKKNKQEKLVGGESPDVTDDTTNKGLRPRNPPNAKREGKVRLPVFSVQVDLLDISC